MTATKTKTRKPRLSRRKRFLMPKCGRWLIASIYGQWKRVAEPTGETLDQFIFHVGSSNLDAAWLRSYAQPLREYTVTAYNHPACRLTPLGRELFGMFEVLGMPEKVHRHDRWYSRGQNPGYAVNCLPTAWDTLEELKCLMGLKAVASQ